MNLLASVFSFSFIALLLVLSSLEVVDSTPLRLIKRHAANSAEHVVQKRSTTLQDILGDLTAGAPGILNEDSKRLAVDLYISLNSAYVHKLYNSA